ncbi:trypsin-like peptidase domain-containing protein [Chondrinema litorale]|uniref:trypsin-like peptidase domain-containing protein n=1 Tax=Chondrinema litorale TaxID=2994555 RepID=UPI002543BB93|nr:trypsin-like peptidase domain-containing protein [Chondrinema litorale]UZR95078.1 trypsin-like peptidase domain-containing protein [Chondrinema litorale]
MKNIIINGILSLVGGFIGAYIFSINQSYTPSDQAENKQGEFVNYTSDITDSSDNLPAVTNSRRVNINELEDFSDASKISTECVVYIRTISGQEYERYSWFDLFFNNRMNERRVVGSGSGVIFSVDGYIVTNNHVIDEANKIEVIYNRKTYEAELIGTDPSTDLALLKINANNLPHINVSSSRNLEVGDWVLAVGNPFNLNSTVTAGIVSAKGRRINILEDIFPIESFIQTDAAINPGNSGGALVNTKGELVGINTAILSRTGSYAGYGFAVPSDIVTKVVNDIIKYGEVQKAFMGVDVLELDEDLSNKLGTDDLKGVAVSVIEPGGAASTAGMQKGDIIVQIDNFPINTKADYDEILSYHKPGDKLTVKYKRENKTIIKDVILTNIDGTTGISKKIVYNAEKIGATFEVVPKLERTRLGIESGIRISSIDRGGLIYKMDMDKNYIILSINNYKINSPEDLEEILVNIRGRVVLAFLDAEGRKKYYSYRF